MINDELENTCLKLSNKKISNDELTSYIKKYIKLVIHMNCHGVRHIGKGICKELNLSLIVA